MSPEEQVNRGEEARRLMQHPLLAEAFATIEQEVTEAWQNSPARDVTGRESLWLQVKLLHRLRGQLESVMETGKVAQATVAQRAAEAALSIGRRLSGR